MRRRMSVDERRASLLELGLRLFGQRGLDDVSVEDIAREAGVSAGLLYHYFGSKREFHYAVAAHAMSRLAAVTEPDPALAPGQRVVAGLTAYLEYLRADTHGWSWLMRGGSAGDDRLWVIGEEYRATITRWVFQALPPGSESPLTRVAVRGWIGSNTEMALVWLDAGEPEMQAVVRLMVSVLVAVLEEGGVDASALDALRRDADAALMALEEAHVS